MGAKAAAEVRPLFGPHHVSTCNVSQIAGDSRVLPQDGARSPQVIKSRTFHRLHINIRPGIRKGIDKAGIYVKKKK